VICSRDHSAQWLARYYDVEFLDEAALYCSDLNGAVNAAAQRFAREGCTDLLVVHGDLPLLSVQDISDFIARHAGDIPTVTIAPDRRGTGTNLLAWRALPKFSVNYGIDSFQRHCAQARALNAVLNISDVPGARCDIDEPDDLLLLWSQHGVGAAQSSFAFLRDSGIAERLHALQYSANIAYVGDDYDCA
ncbi:MAG TPA: hypothetical protein VGK97_09155, partial [Spongiibacteraceae bacterium]